MTRVRVNTERYEGTYGKRPRGEGHWAFEFGGIAGYQTRVGMYGEVVKEAIKSAKALGAITITVLP